MGITLQTHRNEGENQPRRMGQDLPLLPNKGSMADRWHRPTSTAGSSWRHNPIPTNKQKKKKERKQCKEEWHDLVSQMARGEYGTILYAFKSFLTFSNFGLENHLNWPKKKNFFFFFKSKQSILRWFKWLECFVLIFSFLGVTQTHNQIPLRGCDNKQYEWMQSLIPFNSLYGDNIFMILDSTANNVFNCRVKLF